MDPQQLVQMLMAGGDPEEGDPYQVAGDVVPMRSPGAQADDVIQRLIRAPRGGMGQMGNLGIKSFGGAQNPYIDLLDVLAYPQGGQIRK